MADYSVGASKSIQELDIESFTALVQCLSGMYYAAEHICQRLPDIFQGRFNEKFEDILGSIENINLAIEDLAQGATNQSNETEIVAIAAANMTVAATP